MSDLLEPNFYHLLNNEMKMQNIGITAAELHGFLSGMLAGGNNDDSWKVLLIDMINDGQSLDGSLLKKIEQLYQIINEQLESADFSFQLFLNEESLFSQIDDLAQWINHFLLGLGLVKPQFASMKGDVGDAIYDLRQISKLGYDEDESQEELALAFEEIAEYVRMTVILCHDEFSHHQTNKTVH